MAKKYDEKKGKAKAKKPAKKKAAAKKPKAKKPAKKRAAAKKSPAQKKPKKSPAQKKPKKAAKKGATRSRAGGNARHTVQIDKNNVAYCTIGACTKKRVFGGMKGYETHLGKHHKHIKTKPTYVSAV